MEIESLDRNVYAMECMYIQGCVFLSAMREVYDNGYYDISDHKDLYESKLKKIGFGNFPKVLQLFDFMELFTKLVAQGATLDTLVAFKMSNQPKGFGEWIDDEMMQIMPFNKLLAIKQMVCANIQNVADTEVSPLQSDRFPYASVISADRFVQTNQWPVMDTPACPSYAQKNEMV